MAPLSVESNKELPFFVVPIHDSARLCQEVTGNLVNQLSVGRNSTGDWLIRLALK